MPAVSVITPAWNAAAHVSATIDSVRRQTFTDWEMVVVDDGSTDGTVGLVCGYSALDPRIRLVRQTNAGPSAARNRAMREARGRFFAFLDSDDLWHPEFLQAQIEIFERHPDTGLVTGNGLFLGGPFDGMPTRPITPGAPVLPLTDIIANERAIFIMTVIRRAVFDTIGGFDEAQWTSEDYDFWIRSAVAGFIVRRNPRPLGLYRVRGDSLSRDRVRMIRGMLLTFGKARPHCREGSPERHALETQVARFESELLLEEGKAALECGDCRTAAARLHALRARGGGRLVAATAWLAEHAPRVAVFAYQARRRRPAWLRRRVAGPSSLDEAVV